MQNIDKSQNKEKYKLNISTSNLKAENFPEKRKFDLIVLDVPCSNSGVLNKRAEARHRICKQKIKELQNKQLAFLEKAEKLLNPGGQIWYLTCSILGEENEEVIEKARDFNLIKYSKEHLVLPNEEGKDGGFACILKSLF